MAVGEAVREIFGASADILLVGGFGSEVPPVFMGGLGFGCFG